MILNGCQNAVEGQPAASSLRWSSHDYWERIKLDSSILLLINLFDLLLWKELRSKGLKGLVIHNHELLDLLNSWGKERREKVSASSN
jgi:hypothetical protein